MADTTTELEVLDQIVDVLGGQSGQYETVVPVLQQIKELLASGITDPESIAEAVAAWLNEHPEATTTVQEGSITVMKLAQDVIELLDNKADIDGYYSQLTAGLAENLIGRGDAVPAEYLYRTAGGTADIEDGIATIDCIKGNTLVWNQLCKTPYSSAATTDWNGVTVSVDSNNYVTMSGTITKSGTWMFMSNDNVGIVAGHKYLISGLDEIVGLSFRVYSASGNITHATVASAMKRIIIPSVTSPNLSLYMMAETSGAEVSFKGRPQLFDLTLMFGAGNEPATVEEFEAMFPLPYYPYSAPKLLPVDMRGIETVGFNLLDIERSEVINTRAKGGAYENTAMRDLSENQVWVGITMNNYFNPNNITSYNIGNESVSVSTVQIGYGLGFPVKVFPNTEYHVDCGAESNANAVFAICAYTEDGAYIQYLPINAPGTSKSITFTTPSNCRWAMVILRPIANTVANAVHPVLNLSWSGYRNGEYEEYWSAERPIDTSRFFPTGLKKVGNKADALYADHYDTAIGAVDLGTLTWANPTTGIFNVELSGMSTGVNNKVECANYGYATNNFNWANVDSYGDKTISTAENAYIYVKDTAYTDAATFKAAMSGVILYYELATPTTTPIDPPLNLSYRVSDFGTERITVDETADAPQTAPVPMEVEYGINAIDTIRRLPKEYQSHKSMGQLTAALESSLGVDITETWDETNGRYEYEVSDFELADDTFACIAAPDGPTATANHAVGTYLIMGGKFYKVTTAIAAGDTIAAGTNVTQTTVMDELIALTA